MKSGEKIYKTMNLTGAITLTAGIVIIVRTGLRVFDDWFREQYDKSERLRRTHG